MFDVIKRVIGRSTCRNCIYRRMWGLYCGKPNKQLDIFPHHAWQKYGCWHYVDCRPLGLLLVRVRLAPPQQNNLLMRV